MDVQEVLGSLNVSVSWIRPSSMKIIASEVQQLIKNPFQYGTEVQINSADSSDAGIYSCEAQVVATNFSVYLTQSSTTSNTTEVVISMHDNVVFFLSCM